MEGIYHDHLFEFARAYDLNKHRVELDPTVSARAAFAEKQLTTERFEECVEKWNQFQTGELDENHQVVRAGLVFACRHAAGNKDEAESAQALLKISGTLQKVGWTFTGTKHFLAEHPAFAQARDAWQRLFTALEDGNGPELARSVREIEAARGN